MSCYNQDRRRVLHCATAVGFTLVVPSISGCNSRDSGSLPREQRESGQQSIPGGSVGAATQPGATQGPEEQAVAKITKSQAKYQDSPNNDQSCANCVHFIAGSNTCRLVDGPISSDGWCSLWSKA